MICDDPRVGSSRKVGGRGMEQILSLALGGGEGRELVSFVSFRVDEGR